MDVEKIKKQFPILSRKIHGKPLVYLDNAATTQKPEKVIETVSEYYRMHNANVHRGIHTLGDESTRVYAEAREKVAWFLGARKEELVFVRNTTEAINMVAYAWARKNLTEGQVIVLSELEHHSNLVTWQEVAKEIGVGICYVSVTDPSTFRQAQGKTGSGQGGQVDVGELEMLLDEIGDEVGLVALSAVSNATGAELPIESVVKMVRKKAKKAKILLDAAQSVPHKKTEFKKWGLDFLAFSGHKMYGPMGIGGLVVKKEVLENMGPFLTGGGMIGEVYLTGSTWGELPDRFDAGTPNVAGAVGLAAAAEFLESVGMDEIERHGRELVEYALEQLGKVREVKIIGPVEEILRLSGSSHRTRWAQDDKSGIKSFPDLSKGGRLGSVAFLYEEVHAHDVAQILDSQGVAVRSGHHCTMPLHKKFGWVATTRASFGIYNTREDVDRLVEGLKKVKKVFKSK